MLETTIPGGRASDDLLVHEALLRMRKLPQFMSDHILGNCHREVVLSVMHEKTDPAQRQVSVLETTTYFDTYPTKWGRIVHERASVLMGVLLVSASRTLGKETKKGPAYRLATFGFTLPLDGLPFHAGLPERRMIEGNIG